MEEWKRAVGFEGYYMISSEGRLMKCAKSGSIYPTTALDHTGYERIKLNCNGVTTDMSVHRLVAQAFISNPEGKRTVNHIDGDKSNNRLVNLEWMTHSENHKHAYDTLGRKSACEGKFGKDHHRSKRVEGTSEGVSIYFDSLMDAQRAGYSAGHISSCCSGKRNTHKGYSWKYL